MGFVHSLWKQKEYMDPSRAVNGRDQRGTAVLNIVQNINIRETMNVEGKHPVYFTILTMEPITLCERN